MLNSFFKQISYLNENKASLKQMKEMVVMAYPPTIIANDNLFHLLTIKIILKI